LIDFRATDLHPHVNSPSLIDLRGQQVLQFGRGIDFGFQRRDASYQRGVNGFGCFFMGKMKGATVIWVARLSLPYSPVALPASVVESFRMAWKILRISFSVPKDVCRLILKRALWLMP